jgi:hypothetical protein
MKRAAASPKSEAKVNPISDDWREQAVVNLHIAEYSALMTRATYFITLQVGMWSLMAIYLGFVAQFSKPEGLSLGAAFDNLLQRPAERGMMLWGNLFILGLMLKVCSQFIVEQYRIILYIETDLRAMVHSVHSMGMQTHFWHYERSLAPNVRGVFAAFWEYSNSIGMFAGVLTLGIVIRPLTWYDFGGIIINIVTLAFLMHDSYTSGSLRKQWERALVTPS